ncbi:MAG: hypothetical protein FWD88_02100 [Treponema sp.]|nr:hypothetical protein [Treponema sp.]
MPREAPVRGDFDTIPEIVKAPDFAIIGVKRDGKSVLVYAKKMGNGTVLYFEEVLQGRKNRTLRGKTLYKMKGDVSEKKLLAIVTLNRKTDASKAKIVSEVGGHPHDKDAKPHSTAATSAKLLADI